ncbi:glycosyltransferase [uncultured Selenomonas sp.]|uniref:glycosyltransferase n=1 Tax=uncultured Selenomonas sp. TaxID=159275 RepID=UPI0025F6E111|nr:glycosyltransferase [uncultured Selenomonas sp.]
MSHQRNKKQAQPGAGKLSGLVIARDAAEDIRWCLESFRGEVDELIVVDTGSRDATADIARELGAQVFSFAWNDDFSAARNFALSKATGDWVFFPDADEHLVAAHGALRQVAAEAAARGSREVSLYRASVDADGKRVGVPDHCIRMFARVADVHYRDPIHELLTYADGKPGVAYRPPITTVCLEHRGYQKDRLVEKEARNLRILEACERNGIDKYALHYYLANTYVSLHRYEDACREAELSLSLGEHPAVGALTLWSSYEMAVEMLGDRERLQALCERAAREVPDLPGTYARLGVLAMNRGDFAEGERQLLEAKRRGALFAEACPDDFDLFAETLPHVEELLAECRRKLGKAPAETVAGAPVPQGKPAGERALETMPEAHETFAEALPAAARVTVLFGCGDGAAGAELLRRNPAMRVYGFSATRAEAVAAGGVLTAAACAAPADVTLADYGLSGVDVIAYAAPVCEGLTTAAIARHMEALAADGQMVFFAAASHAAAQAVLSELPEGPHMVTVEPRQVDGRAMVLVRLAMKKRPTISVQTMIGEVPVTARVRVLEPDEFGRAETGWFFVSNAENRVSRQLAEQTDASIIVRHRAGFTNYKDAMEVTSFLREKGHVIIYEIDDNPILWQKKNEASRYLDYIGAHAVQVSTPALAELLRPYNPHILLMENELKELPAARDYAAEAAAKDGRVTIFFGAVNRGAEWQEIVPVLNKLAKRYGDKLEFLMISNGASYEALHAPHKRFVGDPRVYGGQFVPYPVYQQALHAADIALLPLRDNAFNRTKSDLKFIESAGHGAAVLASPTVYAQTIVDGCTGCIYRNRREFEAKLVRLIEDAPYRQAIARAAYGYVRDHRLIAQHYRARLTAYQALVEHRAELDAELAARLEHVRKEAERHGDAQ